ncbi:MAG TPA: MFS transporter [Candidatus Caccousia avistercoris]|nr:MFS transporter [Candidatus Caccousia avistercoris]
MAGKTREKFTKQEKSWILYDWANSVYATNIMAAIFPIYFTSVCGQDTTGMEWWGYGTSLATLIVAVMAPILGGMGDYRGMKKKFFTFFMLVGVFCTLIMAIFDNWQMLLVGYVLSYIGFAGSCLFYDSFLTDVTTRERMDMVSSWGYAMGYIGGSTIPFLLSIAILLVMGMDNPTAVKIVVVLTSVWWGVFSIPMMKNVHQKYYIDGRPERFISSAFSNVGRTLRSIFQNKGLFFYLIAYFCYIDGVGTVIHMSTSYGSTLGLDTTGMILALLVTQVVAMPCSILFGRLAKRAGAIRMIGVAIGVYFVICLVGFYMGYSIEVDPNATGFAQTLFWMMAFLVGTVQGGVQALSRSYFSRLVPPDKSNEYFGFFDIFGKFATVVGPFLVSAVTSATGRSSLGILSLLLLFALGGLLLFLGRKPMREAEAAAEQARGQSAAES